MWMTPERREMFREIAREHRFGGPGPNTYCWKDAPHSHDMWPYIQLCEEDFILRIKPHLAPGMRVIDVGCGAGDKLLLFKDLENTLDITGVEIDPVMCKVARRVAPFATIIEGDAFHVNYSRYDLIYMYWPIANFARQADLQQLCSLQMKPNATLIVVGQQSHAGDQKEFPDFGHGWKR